MSTNVHTLWLKIAANFSVDIYLLHQYERNFSHFSDFYSLVIGLWKSEIPAKIFKNEILDEYLLNMQAFEIL